MAAAKPGTSCRSPDPLDFHTPAPAWARELAEQAVRERDAEPETFCSTPRGEEVEDLRYWMRAAERLVEAGENGHIGKREWVRWGEYFDTLPGVGEHFRALLAKDHARAEAPGRKALELAEAVEAVPTDARGLWLLSCPVVWGQNNYAYLPAPWPVCQGIRVYPYLLTIGGYR